MLRLTRNEMVETQLIERGIRDKRVISAFKKIPRERFTLREYVNLAYEDGPLPIGYDQTISQPFIVALMSEALDIRKDHSVLEIGTGSGYQTAILAELAKEVYTIERIKPLQERAEFILEELGYTNITFMHSDGSKGSIDFAPYDRIMVTAAAKKIPKDLVEQLRDGGKMVIPVGGSWFQDLVLVVKTDGKIKTESLGGCRFVPLIEEK